VKLAGVLKSDILVSADEAFKTDFSRSPVVDVTAEASEIFKKLNLGQNMLNDRNIFALLILMKPEKVFTK
jgi:hypothetical protein